MPFRPIPNVVRLRRMARVAPLVLCFVGGALTAGLLGAKNQKVQSADRYELVDAEGQVRGVLGTWEDSPYLRLQEDGGAGVMVLTRNGEVSLSMYTDAPRHPRVHVSAGASGSTFTMLDRNGRASVRVELDAHGRLVELTERPEPHPGRSDGLGALGGIWETTPR